MAKITSRVNSKKWLKYTSKEICGLSILFFREIPNTIMREYTIPFTENVLKQLQKQ